MENGSSLADFDWIVVLRDGAWDVYVGGTRVADGMSYSDALALAQYDGEP